MNTKKFSEAMNQVGDKYYEEALDYRKNAAKPVWARWGTEQIGNVRQFIRYSSAGKRQRHKADSKRYIKEIKCFVRGNVRGTDCHYQKTETDQA